jgi:hypothetical protein
MATQYHFGLDDDISRRMMVALEAPIRQRLEAVVSHEAPWGELASLLQKFGPHTMPLLRLTEEECHYCLKAIAHHSLIALQSASIELASVQFKLLAGKERFSMSETVCLMSVLQASAAFLQEGPEDLVDPVADKDTRPLASLPLSYEQTQGLMTHIEGLLRLPVMSLIEDLTLGRWVGLNYVLSVFNQFRTEAEAEADLIYLTIQLTDEQIESCIEALHHFFRLPDEQQAVQALIEKFEPEEAVKI